MISIGMNSVYEKLMLKCSGVGIWNSVVWCMLVKLRWLRNVVVR